MHQLAQDGANHRPVCNVSWSGSLGRQRAERRECRTYRLRFPRRGSRETERHDGSARVELKVHWPVPDGDIGGGFDGCAILDIGTLCGLGWVSVRDGLAPKKRAERNINRGQ
jgi:hypothetical protein